MAVYHLTLFQQFSPSRPGSINWNIDSQGSLGICCRYKRPSPSRFSCGVVEMSGSSLPGQMVPTRAANIWPVRLEWRFGGVSSILQSTFNNCQLGTLHSSPRSGLLFVWLSAITFNNRPLVTRQKVNNYLWRMRWSASSGHVTVHSNRQSCDSK